MALLFGKPILTELQTLSYLVSPMYSQDKHGGDLRTTLSISAPICSNGWKARR